MKFTWSGSIEIRHTVKEFDIGGTKGQFHKDKLVKIPVITSIGHEYPVPWFYGLCWFEEDRDVSKVAIIPINIFMAVGHWSYLWLRYRFSRLLIRHLPKKG